MDLIQDEIYIKRALELSERGKGFVSPNPLVGAVIVNQSGEIIGEGWHKQFGSNHAEVNAMNECGKDDLKSATLYVTLEPCDHYGKTPPCTDVIIENGIRRVVIALRDPNPIVNGRGIKKFRENGIEVVVGVLEQQAKLMNESFLHFVKTSNPFITLKTAQTLDGFVAMPDGTSKWITGELALQRVHKLRSFNDAIIIGGSTAIKDDPSLTVRYGIESRIPRRIILDLECELPLNLQLFNDEFKEHTLVFTSEKNINSNNANSISDKGINVLSVGSDKSGLRLDEVLSILGSMNLASIMVESGGSLAASFIQNKSVNKLISFVSPKLFGKGIQVFNGIETISIDDAIKFNIHNTESVGEDIMVTMYP